MEDEQVFAVIGEEGFQKLVAAFYRQVPSDDILGPMYPPDDFVGAEERLRTFLVFRFGGPPVYLENRGHPRLRMRHAPFPIDAAARARWLQLMGRALDEVSFPRDVRTTLETFFRSTATAMMNRDVPTSPFPLTEGR